MADNVNHPAHYEAGPFECVELTRLYPFMGGNAIKYVYRHRLKGREVEDLRKALWYLDHAEPDELRPSYTRRDVRDLGAATPLPVPSMEADLALPDNGAAICCACWSAPTGRAWPRSGGACGSWPAGTTRG